MEIERQPAAIDEHRVLRRGLLAGAIALGVGALSKLASPERAQAQGEALIVGNTAGGNPPQSETSTTYIIANHASAGFVVATGSTAPSAAISGETAFAGNVAVQGLGDGGAIGVLGENRTNGDSAPGVEGRNNASDGTAVRGINTRNGTGVRGVSNMGGSLGAGGNGSGIGVHGKSGSGPGVQGESTSSLGVRGLSTNFVGVVGISDSNHGLYGSTSGPSAAGLVGENLSGGVAGFFEGIVQIYGSLQVFGAKNAVIKMQDGTNAAVYCQESPEPYFEDFGRARLAGGVANVALEPEFASLVARGEYMVHLTPEGDSRGLYVARRDATGFEVREAQGGTSSLPFTYRVVTRRKDIEGKRFARVSDATAKGVAATRAALRMGAVIQTPGNPPAAPFPTQVNPTRQP